MDEQDMEDRLLSAAKAIKDDIRSLFVNHPEYRDYLNGLLRDAAEEIRDLREQIPAPPPDPNERT
jgi:hypothetical protein